MNAPAVSNAETTDIERIGERRMLLGGQNRIIQGKFGTEFLQASAQRAGIPQLSDFWIRMGHEDARGLPMSDRSPVG